ncbi:extracellular solute-binding protein [Plastorhodobacter daqingensis]|uniref:Extracellular solute-binding protein n=1 Tax=Plastorhodobacter daqingensis TaxID=1387281 RepID=A0ABW2UJQ8_9RHOB
MMQAILPLLRGGVLALALVAAPALAEPRHGIAMYGDPALPPDFAHLPHVNPDAPKGGRIVFGDDTGFDSLNPYIIKGRAPWGIRTYTVESLMGRNYDEPFALYGVLAESVETDESRSFVEFTLREGARFSDGSPVTVEDVLWSVETLGTSGSPVYHAAWRKVASAEQSGPRSVRFTFTAPDRELPLILGLRPILRKAQWEGVDFAEASTTLPIGSGPYVVDRFERGRFIVFRKNPDWWAADLPFYRGQHNLDEIRFDFFADAGVMFEAFKAGVLTSFREVNASRWASAYDFPALRSGEVVRSEIPHQRPSGITGLVMNTRRAPFDDWRVREALIQAFNFEFINNTLNGGSEPRITSYFSNSPLGMDHGPAEGQVRALLEPHADQLLPGVLEGYSLPETNGEAANRSGIRRATQLLDEAGWTVENGQLRNAAGDVLSIEVLLQQGASEAQSIAAIFAEALRRLGITLRVTMVDSAQYTDRTNNLDFDMTWFARSMSLSPGTEQIAYWGSASADVPGTRNWMGVKDPVVDALIENLLTTTSQEEFTATAQALDRVLTAGRFVIPTWYANVGRIAHVRALRYPDRPPLYGDWLGFQPEVWWYEP